MSPLFRVLGSLHMAVPLLVAIAGVLAWGTIYETRFGTAAVQRFIYQAWWFQALLGFLAVNLAIAAAARYPWQRRHAPFLLAHLGIILMLIGGIIGGRFGIEGQLIILEGQAERVLQLPTNVLVVHQPNPGTAQVFATRFETTAWVHEPHALFRVPHGKRVINLVVDRYYPDAVEEEQILEGGSEPNPAVELALAHGEQEERVWLMARDPERFGVRWGEAHILFLEPSSPAQWAGLVGLSTGVLSGVEWAPRGVVAIDIPDHGIRTELPVPEALGAPVPIEGTPYTVTFREYFTDLAITEQGVVNRSPELNNPAIALTLAGPEGTEPFLAFALHPDFELLHGQTRKLHAHVTYHHAGRPLLPPNAICLVRHPAGALSCVLTGASGEAHVAPCEAGRRYTHPWLGYGFEIVREIPAARVARRFLNRSDEIKAEAIHVTAQDGQAVAGGWIDLRGTLELPLGGTAPMRVGYRPAEQELPFTVKLIDFRKIDYPGTQMAAGFESDVQVTDATWGLILMRTISMNKPLRYRGFSLYQSSYVPGDPETTILSVRNDPGTPFVYAGFLVVILGVASMFILKTTARDSTSTARAP